MGLTVDASGFLGAMDAAARYIGAGEGTDAALRPEIGKVLERAVHYTKVPDEETFRQRIEYGLRSKFNTYAAGEVGVAAREELPRISIAPKAGHVWWVDNNERGKKTFYLMNGGPRKNWGNRYTRYLMEEADRAADLAQEIQEYLPKAEASRGLSKQSWVQIADALGIPLQVQGYIRAAAATTGRTYENGTGTRIADGESLMYTLVNTMPTLINPKKPGEGLAGAQILQSALNTREKAIMIAIEKGIFDDLEKAVRRFPGLSLLR